MERWVVGSSFVPRPRHSRFVAGRMGTVEGGMWITRRVSVVPRSVVPGAVRPAGDSDASPLGGVGPEVLDKRTAVAFLRDCEQMSAVQPLRAHPKGGIIAF